MVFFAPKNFYVFFCFPSVCGCERRDERIGYVLDLAVSGDAYYGYDVELPVMWDVVCLYI